MTKIKPYSGDKSYIFISYAHRNSDVVFPIIEHLINDGYRVWYDEGIVPGSEWDEYIAKRIKSCACMISMITPQYMQSDNCKDELNYARDIEKKQLLVYLAPTTLSDGLQLRLNRIQAVLKYRYTKDSDFYAKMYEADVLYECKDSNAPNIKRTSTNAKKDSDSDFSFTDSDYYFTSNFVAGSSSLCPYCGASISSYMKQCDWCGWLIS